MYIHVDIDDTNVTIETPVSPENDDSPVEEEPAQNPAPMNVAPEKNYAHIEATPDKDDVAIEEVPENGDAPVEVEPANDHAPEKDDTDMEVTHNVARRAGPSTWKKFQPTQKRLKGEAFLNKKGQAGKTCGYYWSALSGFCKKSKLRGCDQIRMKTKKGYCYCWDEANLPSEVFAHLQHNHFSKVLEDNTEIKKLTIWSDSCGYQNRKKNTAITNMYFHLASSSDIVIEQKYLVSGHTQMECDSMHSTIEKEADRGHIHTS